MATTQEEVVGSYIRTITIDIPEEHIQDSHDDQDTVCPVLLPAHANNDVIRVTCQALQLQSFHMENLCRPSLLSILCLTPLVNTIRSLHITLDISRMPSEILVTVTPSLNRFHGLEDLSMTCYHDWPIADTPGLRLARLRAFTWKSRCYNQGANAVFLDRCHLEDLTVLRLLFWDDDQFRDEGLRSIRRFLGRLPRLHSLALSLPDQHLIDFLPHIPSHITLLDFSEVDLTETILPAFPKSVTRLRVSVSSDPADPFWDLLGRLAAEDTELQLLFLTIWDIEGATPFSWSSGLAGLTNYQLLEWEAAILTGRLLAHATVLSRKCIKILDGEGRTASVCLSNILPVGL
jgi:hypothetical protein